MNVTRFHSFCIGYLIAAVALSACQDRRADKAYLKGDYDASAKELQSLANLGEPRAQYDLALLYDKGLGVPQSDAQALLWYTKAAEHGDARAQYNLGLMYMNGQGMAPDLILAYYWLSLSLGQGDEQAAPAREYLVERMTAEQIDEAKKLVRERLIRGERPTAREVHHEAP